MEKYSTSETKFQREKFYIETSNLLLTESFVVSGTIGSRSIDDTEDRCIGSRIAASVDVISTVGAAVGDTVEGSRGASIRFDSVAVVTAAISAGVGAATGVSFAAKVGFGSSVGLGADVGACASADER